MLNTLADLIDGLAVNGDGPAIVAADAGTWSRDRLRQDALRFAAGLASLGVRPGEAVGLLAPSQPKWVIALLGIVRSGALAMPLNEQMSEQDLHRVLEHSDCRALVTTAPLATGTPAFGRVPQLILLDDEVPPDFGRSDARSWTELLATPPDQLPELAPDQPTVLVYTSGTTGTPKGVPLSHAQPVRQSPALAARGPGASPTTACCCRCRLHHAYPLTVGLLAAARDRRRGGAAGGHHRAARSCARCRTSRCTIMVGVPRLYEAMLAGIERQIAGAPRLVRRRAAQACSRSRSGCAAASAGGSARRLFWPLHRRLGPALRLLASGGARLEPEIAWRLEGLGWQVLTGYGLTETAPILTFNPPGRARLDSAGLPVEGVELRIAPPPESDPDGPSAGRAGRDPGPRARTCSRATGTIPRRPREAFTADGFFRTGDLGRLDDDGYLHIVGRSKELIVLAGGKNIFPEEVETVYGDSRADPRGRGAGAQRPPGRA